MATFIKTGNRLIALAHDPVARGRLYEMAMEDIEFSSIQLMELDNLHHVGYDLCASRPWRVQQG